MTLAGKIREKLVGPIAGLGAAAKIFVVVILVAVLVIISFIVIVSKTISDRMEAAVDRNLGRDLKVLETALESEGSYLRAEARTLAGLEGVREALREGDVQRLESFASTIQETHDLDVAYVVSGKGDLVAGWGGNPPEPGVVGELPLVQEALAGKDRTGIVALGDTAWLAGVAPLVGSYGQVDAVFLVARELDRDYLKSVTAALASHAVLIEGPWVVSCLPVAEHEYLLAEGVLADLLTGQPDLRDVVLEGEPYRVLTAPLVVAGSPSPTVGLFYPTEHIRDARREAIGRVVLLGGVLVGLALVLAGSHFRTVFTPLHSLTRAAEHIAGGDLARPIDVRGTADIKALASSFERMRTALRDHIEAQQRWSEELDARVRARTAELEEVCRARDRLTARIIGAQEDERQRVARELHDDTSQMLASLIVSLGTLSRLTHEADVLELLERAKRLAVETVEGVNRIVLGLRPRLLDDYGLLPAIRWYADECLRPMGVEVCVEERGVESRLPRQSETAVFRVVQEAVSNIARHARATHTKISLTWGPASMRVCIDDNGQGFDGQGMMGSENRQRSLGLLGMEERVALLGGKLDVASARGSGTHITFEIPLLEPRKVDGQD